VRRLRWAVSWTIEILAAAVVLRWLAIRLRRVLLLPTEDTTPPITTGQVRPGIRRLILSDLHMGAGDRLDDFDADADLIAFIRAYALREEPVELILAGDTFEFLQVRLPGLGDYEWSGAAAEQRLRAILSAHAQVIAALRDFAAQPDNQLTLLVGNHDFELHYASAKALLREALGLAPDDGRLRFGLSYEGGGIYLEHGNQFDEWNRFVHFEGISEPFEVVRGTRVVKDVINPMEDDPLDVAPMVDNVKPTSAFFWYMLSLPRLRQPAVRRYVVRGLMRLFRTVALPRAYHRAVLEVREELLGAPGQTIERELALQAVYELDPELQAAAAANHGGVAPKVQLRRRADRPATESRRKAGPAQTPSSRPVPTSGFLRPGFTRRLARDRESSEAAESRRRERMADIEREAGRQLRREIREFKGALLRGMARIAAGPQRGHNTLFVCGHTHLVEVVELNERQVYVNTGTWTPIVHDIRTNRRQEQRFPFLEVLYPDSDERPRGRLLVWQGLGAEPRSWVATLESDEDDDVTR
jgi:UDP-2,3-diacylglucosamine pyrophosphatase LpxH